MGALRIFLYGGYRNRTPLAYAPIRQALGDRIILTDSPSGAQLVVISHFRDFELFGTEIASMLATWPRLRLVLLSEEPYWDSCWTPDPFTRQQWVQTDAGRVIVTLLNHETSHIYRGAHIPYFLLTDTSYLARYRASFARNAGRSATDWYHHFRQTRHDAVFLMARRTSASLAPDFGNDALLGLSVWRSQMAERCVEASRQGRVICEGQGWSQTPPRQDLSDWHADKFARFDLSTRYMAAFENTHQRDYISEKIWDAFALGAIPLYLAGSDHALHRLIRANGWINFHSSLPQVPAFDATQPVSLAMAEDYAAQQVHLARCFCDMDRVCAEYERFSDALVAELSSICAA